MYLDQRINTILRYLHFTKLGQIKALPSFDHTNNTLTIRYNKRDLENTRRDLMQTISVTSTETSHYIFLKGYLFGLDSVLDIVTGSQEKYALSRESVRIGRLSFFWDGYHEGYQVLLSEKVGVDEIKAKISDKLETQKSQMKRGMTSGASPVIAVDGFVQALATLLYYIEDDITYQVPYPVKVPRWFTEVMEPWLNKQEAALPPIYTYPVEIDSAARGVHRPMITNLNASGKYWAINHALETECNPFALKTDIQFMEQRKISNPEDDERSLSQIAMSEEILEMVLRFL